MRQLYARPRALGLAAALLSLIALAGCNKTDSAAAPPPPANVGENVEYSQVGLKVNSILRLSQIGDFFKPAPGDVFVTVNVTITNKRPYQTPYRPYHFTLKDSAGTVYQAGVTAGSQILQSSTLDATKDVTGNINFDVPQSAQGLALIYQVPGTNGAITVNLGDVGSIPTPSPTPLPTQTNTPGPAPTPAEPTVIPTVEQPTAQTVPAPTPVNTLTPTPGPPPTPAAP